jgi:hypothetical protein
MPATEDDGPGLLGPDLDEDRRQRRAALQDPGPSWREWLFGSAFKMWLGIALLIIDSWIAAGWAEAHGWYGLAISLGVAVYLELLLYQYLWHTYRPELRGKFRPSWWSPWEVGRWSPDRQEALHPSGRPVSPDHPDPREFL